MESEDNDSQPQIWLKNDRKALPNIRLRVLENVPTHVQSSNCRSGVFVLNSVIAAFNLQRSLAPCISPCRNLSCLPKVPLTFINIHYQTLPSPRLLLEKYQYTPSKCLKTVHLSCRIHHAPPLHRLCNQLLFKHKPASRSRISYHSQSCRR